jgi:hypothetical protein
MALHTAAVVGLTLIRSEMFRELVKYEARLFMARRARQKHPTKVPVIVERDRACKTLPVLEHCKFLCDGSSTMAAFLMDMRSRMEMDPTTAMFLFVGKDVQVGLHRTMGELYDRYKEEDELLYVRYSGESTFG